MTHLGTTTQVAAQPHCCLNPLESSHSASYGAWMALPTDSTCAGHFDGAQHNRERTNRFLLVVRGSSPNPANARRNQLRADTTFN